MFLAAAHLTSLHSQNSQASRITNIFDSNLLHIIALTNTYIMNYILQNKPTAS